MPHPDYESFQIPAEVQEEYRKLVLQKRIVKWADGNEYDAEAVDAAIETGEISTQLTEKEIERLKQILWAKAEETVVKYNLTGDWDQVIHSYEDDHMYAQAWEELTVYVMEHGTYNSGRDAYELFYGDDPEAIAGLDELVSINGQAVLDAMVMVDSNTGTPMVMRLTSYPEGEEDYHERSGIHGNAQFKSPELEETGVMVQYGLAYYHDATDEILLDYGDLGFTSMADYEEFLDHVFSDTTPVVSINDYICDFSYYNGGQVVDDISQATSCTCRNSDNGVLTFPTAASLPEARQAWGSDTAVASFSWVNYG